MKKKLRVMNKKGLGNQELTSFGKAINAHIFEKVKTFQTLKQNEEGGQKL